MWHQVDGDQGRGGNRHSPIFDEALFLLWYRRTQYSGLGFDGATVISLVLDRGGSAFVTRHVWCERNVSTVRAWRASDLIVQTFPPHSQAPSVKRFQNVSVHFQKWAYYLYFCSHLRDIIRISHCCSAFALLHHTISWCINVLFSQLLLFGLKSITTAYQTFCSFLPFVPLSFRFVLDLFLCLLRCLCQYVSITGSCFS